MSGTARKKPGSLKRLTIVDFILIAVISILCLTCILPLLHVAAKSLSSNTAVLGKEVYLWPKDFNLDAYKRVFSSGIMMSQLWFTVMITVLQTVLQLVVISLAAYPLSRRYLPGRFAITMFVMFTMYFSAGLIPAYLLYKDLHLLNKMWVLVLPGAFSAYNMLLMRTYFMNSVPESLEESATIDGAGQFRILLTIWLPLSKPILATVALFVAVGRWNGYADAMYYTTKRSLQPLQLLLYNMILNATPTESLVNEAQVGSAATPEVIQSAVIMFATVPILMIYPFVQKYFVKGAMIGAVKG